jgi:hypothetical protein
MAGRREAMMSFPEVIVYLALTPGMGWCEALESLLEIKGRELK